jgi:predicted ArsR family transcriptional regulator
MDHTDLDQQLTALAGLGDPIRRALYRYVAKRGVPVSRDDAAQAAGISRPLAAYHLDKLIDDGLLEARYQRRSGRRWPGAGRPAKHYVRAHRQLELSLPTRDDGALAELLASAVEADPSGAAKAALNRAAGNLGADLGTEAASHTTANGDPDQVLAALREALAARGYEPYEDADGTSGSATAPSTASPPTTATWSAAPTTPCSRPSPTASTATCRSARCSTRSPDAAASPYTATPEQPIRPDTDRPPTTGGLGRTLELDGRFERADTRMPPASQVSRPRSGPRLANWTRPDTGQGSAGTPGTGPTDRVTVVADKPLDAAGHGYVVLGQGAVVPGGERNRDAIAAEVDSGLAAGDGGVVGHPADEPRRGAEVVEVEGLLDAVAIVLPAG